MPMKPKGFCDLHSHFALAKTPQMAEMPMKPKGFCDRLNAALENFEYRSRAEMPMKPKGFCDISG